MTKKIKITLVRSPIAYNKNIRDTVKALGFKRVYQTLEKVNNPAVMGMINKVQFMLKIGNAR